MPWPLATRGLRASRCRTWVRRRARFSPLFFVAHPHPPHRLRYLSNGNNNNERGGGRSPNIVLLDPPTLKALRDTAREPTPPSLLVFPLWQKPVFPGAVTHAYVPDEAFQKHLLAQVDKGNRAVGLFLTRAPSDSSEEVRPITTLDALHPIGMLASMLHLHAHGGVLQVLLTGIRRIVATGVVPDVPRLTVTAEDLKEEPYDKDNPLIRAHCSEIIQLLREIARMEPFHREQIHMLGEHIDMHNPPELADLVAALSSSREASQKILEELDVTRRLRLALEQLHSEVETAKIRTKLHKEVEKNFADTQRKYFLKEQLNIIQKELGITVDERGALVEKFKKRLVGLVVPEAARKVIDDELAKLATLEPSGSEFNVTRTYLDWLTQLPWGVYKTEKLVWARTCFFWFFFCCVAHCGAQELDHARQVLDEDHYGLKELKDRILEFIAVGNLRGGVSGKIIMLVGPPGTGKTRYAAAYVHRCVSSRSQWGWPAWESQ